MVLIFLFNSQRFQFEVLLPSILNC
uniref:Uncharacterized protein n=1 Tax=Anguilla anguilla TaxID=7936 RepID=A0A0E9SGE4_ANGAN